MRSATKERERERTRVGNREKGKTMAYLNVPSLSFSLFPSLSLAFTKPPLYAIYSLRLETETSERELVSGRETKVSFAQLCAEITKAPKTYRRLPARLRPHAGAFSAGHLTENSGSAEKEERMARGRRARPSLSASCIFLRIV